jgi:BirA family biotin operon repressor/biotin-[acetyl-CoA-carboxylase] ligase
MLGANQVLEVAESTNDEARKLAEAGCPHGTWVSARTQTSGRGRLGRKWESIEGNLFLSIVVRPPPHAHPVFSWVPLATAIAIAEAVQNFHPQLALQIKWPNDLWLNRIKVGGILCEAAWSRERSFIVIGMGVNCAGAPQNIDQTATYLSAVVPNTCADDIRMPIISAVIAAFDELVTSGHARFSARYEKLAALRVGTAVDWSSGVVGAPVSSGFIEGLGGAGELLTRDLTGKTHSLYSDDVKLTVPFWC